LSFAARILATTVSTLFIGAKLLSWCRVELTRDD
jgi:hypothetical protein